MLLVVQSTMVLGSSVRGSAAKATTTSSVLERSWAKAGTARARTTASTVRAFNDRIKPSSSCLECLDVSTHALVAAGSPTRPAHSRSPPPMDDRCRPGPSCDGRRGDAETDRFRRPATGRGPVVENREPAPDDRYYPASHPRRQ